MTARITSIDFQDIICKLASDKAKAREEGIKLLNTWLDDERTFGFCKFLAEKSSVLKHNDSKNAESWTFLIKNLVQCLSLEISSAKRRQPKLIFAKTLRVVVQHAESDTVSGESYALSPVARLLFNHALNVLRDVPSFQSEYAVLLRHLLAVGGYRFHMRKRVYSDLVLLFMEKVERSLSKESAGQSIPREDVFRFTLTLQSLLENPPGDIPVELRGDMVKGFVRIFSYVRDEGKLPKKLLECINTFLLFDGPNLGWKSFEIHDAVERFVLRYWFSTQDRGLKDALISYVKLQLSLTRGASDGSGFLEKLLDLVFKELDQLSCSNPDAVRDKKCGLLAGSQYNAVDLAALVFRRVLTCTIKKQLSEKRSRQEHIVVQVKERLIEGKWSWHAAAYFLIRNQSFRLETSLCVQWFLGLSENFDRIINTANLEHSYAGLLWTLR
ncbi:hypothetical protein M569_14382 [Genlisea aurea]|uniref:Telomere-length maintenance and DNA damage repair domain-containing protein n=1 Tax=Genlisea aurea TaxID=192259 RepID=S8C0W2_9LAMI|nr:hypothetical protein M569_14382 [Genlisea aurea]